VSDLDKSIAQITESYQSAVYARDVAALMRLYDPHVRVFDTWGVWLYEGAEAWQRAIEGWFTSLGTERVKVTFGELQVTSGRDMAIVSAIVHYAGLSAQGEPLRAMHNRISWGLKLSGHVWRIVHEHTSAPVGFEDMKAILQRAGGS